MNGSGAARADGALPSTERVLELFQPPVRHWFREVYGAATEIQLLSWPLIAGGRHVLLTAPTGSGKTLCAFLWSLNQLLAGTWAPGTTRVLYVSPLKALNNDIRCNLVHPLRQIRERCRREGYSIPEIRILTRSGDTPASERRQMLRLPPEILITTPESFNLLLSSPRARQILAGVETVILDEIHAVAADKRGTHLMTAVERLVLLAGEFQRIALSATVQPLERVAEWIGGYLLDRETGAEEPVYRKRKVEVIRSAASKRLEVRVRFPGSGSPSPGSRLLKEPPAASLSPKKNDRAASPRESFWQALVAECKQRIASNRSTLIFTNTRRHAEKLARLINEDGDAQLAYSHHGSLAKEIRLLVEQKLRTGQLAAIVATSSLELGIDIGMLDEVLLVQTPFSVSSGLQRIGRAGHGVGEVSRGTLYPLHGRDLLNAAVMARCLAEQDIEEIHPVSCPLDVLAQIILSMTGVESWEANRLYDALRTSAPYHDLPRRQFDLVVEMLAGRYAETFVRELRPRLSWDRLDNSIKGRRSALPLIYRSGGTIPDRGYYDLRIRHTAAKIGELDEEFVWERKVGDTFNLGTQNWKIVGIDSKNVEVVPWDGPINLTPFWRAEKAGRDFHYSERVSLFLERWNGRLDGGELENCLARDYFLDRRSARELVGFLKRQKAATGGELPHRHHLLVERVAGPLARASLHRVILHTLWGARVNYPFSLALEGAWQRRHGSRLEVFADDDCLMIIPSDRDGIDVDELLSLVRAESVEELLRETLEGSGFFGARFRENAGRALLVPRSDPSGRIPLWLTRLRSKKLLEAVLRFPEFPIVLETWRGCLQDEFDLPNLKLLLVELAAGEIRRSVAHTASPSPFAEYISWVQTNQYVYAGEAAATSGASTLPGQVIRELLYSSRLRPRIDPALAAELQLKLQRCAAGYAPPDLRELLDWVKERLLLPEAEWEQLLEAAERDHGLKDIEEGIGAKLVRYRLPGAELWVFSAIELMPRLLRAFAQGQEGGDRDPLAVFEALEITAADGAVPPEDALNWLRSGIEGRAGEPGGFEPVEQAGGRPVAPGRVGKKDGQGEGFEEGQAPLLSVLIAEWLRFYTPLSFEPICRLFGLSQQRLEALLEGPVDSGELVVDELTRAATGLEVCDARNLEILLRLARRGARPSFKPLDLDRLPLFLAVHQGIVGKGAIHGEGACPPEPPVRAESSPDRLQQVLETLFGFPAPVRSWEEEIFPARLSPYHPSWLDGLLRRSELQWFGCGRQRVSFCFASDLDLFIEAPTASELGRRTAQLKRLLPALRGRFDFWDLVDHSGMSPPEATAAIWDLVWTGYLAADTFTVLRRAASSGFGSLSPARAARKGSRRGSKGGYDRWRASHPFSGGWYALAVEQEADRDLLDEEQLARDRIYQLLRRYGILFRELVSQELPGLRWPRLFRTLRIMELAGEIISGYFFEGIEGLQFVSQRGFRVLEKGLPEQEIFWICALDPASPCGLGLRLSGLPARLSSNHLVFHGPRLMMVSRRRGAEIDFFVPPDTNGLSLYLGLFSEHLNREAAPWKIVRVQTVNSIPARQSPYKKIFLESGFSEEFKGLVLRGGY